MNLIELSNQVLPSGAGLPTFNAITARLIQKRQPGAMNRGYLLSRARKGVDDIEGHL